MQDHATGPCHTASLYALARETCQGLRVLDARCGDGAGTRMLASWGAAEVVGADPSWDSVRTAGASGAARVRHVQADPAVPGQMDGLGRFDLIVCHGAGAETAAILGGLADHVAPGGAVIASFPAGVAAGDEAPALAALRPLLGNPNQVLWMVPVTGWAAVDPRAASPAEVYGALRLGTPSGPALAVAAWGTAMPETCSFAQAAATEPARRRGWLARLTGR